MASAAASGEFHKTFQALKADVVTALESDPPSSSEASKRLAIVRGALQVALPTLPTYDQRNYDLQIRDLESRLARLRATEKPKQRFAFVSRPASRATVSTSSSTSGTSTPAPASLVLDTTSPAPAFPSAGIISNSSVSAAPAAPAAPATPAASSASALPPAHSTAGPSRVREEHTLSNLSHRLVRPPPISPLPGARGTSIHPARSGDGPPLPSPIGYTLSLESLESCYVDLRPAPMLPPSPSSRPSGFDPEARAEAETEAETEAEVHRLTTLHVKGLTRSVLVAPVVRGSVMLSEVHDSVIILGGQQFRMHSSSNTAVLLHVTSLPVIEHSHGIRFGPYPPFLTDSPFQSVSQHQFVQDFDWPQGGESPNWSRLPDRQSLLPADLPPPPPPSPPSPSPSPSESESATAPSPDDAESLGSMSAAGVEEIVRNVLVQFGIAKAEHGVGVQHVDTSN